MGLGIVRTDQIGLIDVGYFWALFFQFPVILLRIFRLLRDLENEEITSHLADLRNTAGFDSLFHDSNLHEVWFAGDNSLPPYLLEVG